METIFSLQFMLPEFKEIVLTSIYGDQGQEKPLYGGLNKPLKQPLFYAFCDLLDVDYRILAEQIWSYLKQTELRSETELCKILCASCRFLRDFERIDQLLKAKSQKQVFRLLKPFILIQTYFQTMKTDESLRSAEVFHAFCELLFYPEASRVGGYQYEIRNWSFLEKKIHGAGDCAEGIMADFSASVIRNQNPICEQCSGSLELMAVSGFYLLQQEFQVKSCEVCGRSFIPYLRSDRIYCDRNSPKNPEMSCQKYAVDRLWYLELKADKCKKLCRNLYQAKQIKAKRYPDIVEYREAYDQFQQTAKKWKTDVKNGVRTEEEFMAWLRDQ